MLLAVLRRLIADASGTTAVEYALIAAFVSLAGVAALGVMGQELVDIFRDVEAGMASSSP